MSCYISIRACPKPNDFFDELILTEGLQIGDWRFTLHRIPCIAETRDGEQIQVDVRWIYAETDCEKENVDSTLYNKRPALKQAFKILEGMRLTQIEENLVFSMFFEEYVYDGTRTNIEPFQIDASVGILNYQIKDGNNNVIFDAQTNALEKDREQRKKIREDAKNKIIQIQKYTPLLDDPYFRRAWESYSEAKSDPINAMNRLYDIRDAVKKRLGKNTQTLLKINKKNWDRFGETFNNQPIICGRHNGNSPETIRTLTEEEKNFLFSFAEGMLNSFGDYLKLEKK